ncbi:MAG: response regulator [Nitrospinae bacterium]|nr:response regulator [Nitrospinota bacterium]
MKAPAYMVNCEFASPDKELRKLIAARDMEMVDLDIGGDHEAVISLLKDRESGVVFIPTAWLDMFSVKVLNGIVSLKTPFETVIYGPPPDMKYLIAAYNSGLSAYLEMPLNKDLFTQVLNRLKARMAEKIAFARDMFRLKEIDKGGGTTILSPQMVERDLCLAKAFVDVVNKSGPLFDGNVVVLLVSSSHAQQQIFEKFLKSLGIEVILAGGVAEAATALAEAPGCRMVVCDLVLPDGGATTLVDKLRKSLKSEMPRFVVITASPDKVWELLAPETHIDDVIVKPNPDFGVESILPTIIAGIYQTRVT